MPELNNDHSPNKLNSRKKPKKFKAKSISISLSQDLRRDINKLNLPVSKICQQALKVAIKNELELRKGSTSKKEGSNKDEKLRDEGFERLKKDLVIKEEQTTDSKLQTEGAARIMKEGNLQKKMTVTDFSGECFEAGQRWASQEATVEELKKIFEEDDIWTIQSIFAGQGPSIPEEVMEADENDNQLFFDFHDGARDMWWKMKEILEEKGYEI